MQIIHHEYAYVLLFAADFLIVGYAATASVYPKLGYYKTLNNFFVLLAFSLIFSLFSITAARDLFVLNIKNVSLILSICTIIVLMIAYYRHQSPEVISQAEEFIPDRTSKTTVYLILLLCVLAIIGMEVSPFNDVPLWYGLCIPFILFLPGYYTVNMLIPRKDQFSVLERVAGAVFISMIITSIIGLIAVQYAGSLDMINVSVVMVVITFIIVLIYMIRIRSVKEEERFNHRATNIILLIIVALALIGIIASGIYSTDFGTGISSQLNGDESGAVTFEVSGINESANDEGYVSFSDGEQVSVDLNVTNIDSKDTDYTVKVEVENDTTNKVLEEYPVSVSEGDSQVITSNITMSPGQKDIKFILYNSDNEATNIRHLYSNVTSA